MKGINLIIILILTATTVYALDCQYTEEKYTIKEQNVFYEDGNNLDYQLIQITDFKQGKINPYWSHLSVDAQFTVRNNHPEKPISLVVTFSKNGNQDSENLTIDPLGYKKVVRTKKDNIAFDSIRFKFISPEFTFKQEKVKVSEGSVCKKCPSGSDKNCINDGKKSPSDELCGSERRNINGICIPEGEPKYIKDDKKCSTEAGETCQNSPSDCACQENYVCGIGRCIPDCAKPPDGMDCCSGEFRKIKAKESNQPCDCDFECKNHFLCISNTCRPDSNNPPTGQQYCPDTNSFRDIQSIDLNKPCDCDFECKEGICFQEKCQKIIDPKIKCSSGTSVKKGETLQCNIYGSNIKLSKDIKITFTLDVDSGLSFSSTQGCQNVPGSQCIGNYDVADLSNEGISVELEAKAVGDSKIEGKVTFEYHSKKIEEKVPALTIHIYDCGDGRIDIGETKENCCVDVGVDEYSIFKLVNEDCVEREYEEYYNLPLISIIVIFSFIILAIIAIKVTKELTKLSKEKQKEIARKMEKIEAQVRRKEKEIDMDEKLVKKLKKEKAAEEEISIVKERIKKSIKETKDLQKKEKKEKEKLRKERLTPFKNKQGYKVIINENGYEQFAENIKYPSEEGKIFHNWYAKKFIYKKNKRKYPLSWHEYEVHHKDGNKRNNNLNNLEILTKEEHRKKHGL